MLIIVLTLQPPYSFLHLSYLATCYVLPCSFPLSTFSHYYSILSMSPLFSLSTPDYPCFLLFFFRFIFSFVSIPALPYPRPLLLIFPPFVPCSSLSSPLFTYLFSFFIFSFVSIPVSLYPRPLLSIIPPYLSCSSLSFPFSPLYYLSVSLSYSVPFPSLTLTSSHVPFQPLF